MNTYAPTLGLHQRRSPSRAGERASPGGRRAAAVLGQGVRLTCHRTAATTRDRLSTPNEGHGAQRRRCPGVSRRWRVRRAASAGHIKRRSALRRAGKMRKIRGPWKRGPRIGRMSSVTAPQYNPRGSPDSWYRKRCRSAIRTACVQRVSPKATNVVLQSRWVPSEGGK